MDDRDPTEDIWPDPPEDFEEGDSPPKSVTNGYVEPWRKPLPLPLNGHLTQLQPRNDKRPAVLDERIEAAKELARQRRVSGHSLIK